MDLLASAVLNNVDWCALVTGQDPDEASTGVWLVKGRPPSLFPDAITLRPGVSADELAEALTARGSCSVKDSYADVDLEPHGFRQLFRARWVGFTVPQFLPLSLPTGWCSLNEPDGLVSWCAAAELPDVLPTSLLSNPSVRVLAVHRKGRLAGGAIANSSGAVVGISNVFQTDGGVRWVWGEVAAAVGQYFPGMAIVGYERDADLEAAFAAGFTDLGPLRVWLRDAVP